MAEPENTPDLYDTDILIWSEEQAEFLRRRAANALDWDNLAEEIADVGLSQLHAVMSHLRLALLHDLKAEAWPLSRDAEHWRAQAGLHPHRGRGRYTPSMARRIGIEERYRQTRPGLPATVDGTLPLPLPTACPASLEELLGADADE